MDSMRYNINTSFTIEQISVQILSFMCGTFSKAVPTHYHGADCYEIHYIPSGYGLLQAEENTYEIAPGTLYMTGPHILHEQAPTGSDPMQEYCVYMKIKNAPSKGASSYIWDLFTSFPFWFGQDYHDVHGLFKTILDELTCNDTGFQYQLQNLFSQLFIFMVREYEKTKGSNPHTETLPPTDKKTMLIDDYFLYEYQNLSLKTLAENLCLSTRQTQRLLQTYYGKTFQEKKTEARMSNAALLLKNPGKKIAEISDFLGYSSPEQFSTAFRSYYGMSPSKFRSRT